MVSPDIASIARTRARRPGAIAEAWQRRTRRPLLRGDGRLLIVAADHVARGVFSAGSQPEVMADRHELLRRLQTALERPGVDGVLGTADVLDDLALLGALEDKLAIGSVNRGGLAGSTFEIDDRRTGHDGPSAARSGLDGAKVLLRICLEDPSTADMLERVASVVDHMAAAQIPILLEPFLTVRRTDGRLANDLSPDGVRHAIGIASGLGGTSAWSWLKIPVVPDMERVMASTTLPALLLGGDTPRDPADTYRAWEHALRIPGVVGLVVGRSLLYPEDGDVAKHVDLAARLVHRAP